MTMNDILELKQQIIKFGKKLGEKNMSPGTSGNISVRYNENVLITASGSYLGEMTEDEIVAVFAHEMGHNKHKDTIKLMGINVINVLMIAVSLWAVV